MARFLAKLRSGFTGEGRDCVRTVWCVVMVAKNTLLLTVFTTSGVLWHTARGYYTHARHGWILIHRWFCSSWDWLRTLQNITGLIL